VSALNCPSCGTQLTFDVFSGEPRPCTNCGARAAVNETGTINQDPEHQQNINRQKYFEIATVIILILVGFGYLSISTGQTPAANDGSAKIHDLVDIVEGMDYISGDVLQAGEQTIHPLHLTGPILNSSVDIISATDSEVAHTIILSVHFPANETFPADDIAEPAIQEAFNASATLGELLVPRSTESLSKAVNTTAEKKKDGKHLFRGAAQTSSGWKISYIAYREIDKTGDRDIPLLLFIYQQLDAASDPMLQTFNERMFATVNAGGDIRDALHTIGNEVRHAE
jgi:hypothetical protein